MTDTHTPIRAASHDDRRTDLRTIDPHYSHREVFAALDCPDPAVIEPVDVNPVSSDPDDARRRQASKHLLLGGWSV